MVRYGGESSMPVPTEVYALRSPHVTYKGYMKCPVTLYILLGQVSHVDDGEMKGTTRATMPPCWKIVCEPLSKQDKF